MKRPTRIHFTADDRTYHVVPPDKAQKVPAGWICIAPTPTDYPTPFRWPPLHYSVEWRGSTAHLTILI